MVLMFSASTSVRSSFLTQKSVEEAKPLWLLTCGRAQMLRLCSPFLAACSLLKVCNTCVFVGALSSLLAASAASSCEAASYAVVQAEVIKAELGAVGALSISILAFFAIQAGLEIEQARPGGKHIHGRCF